MVQQGRSHAKLVTHRGISFSIYEPTDGSSVGLGPWARTSVSEQLGIKAASRDFDDVNNLQIIVRSLITLSARACDRALHEPWQRTVAGGRGGSLLHVWQWARV